MKMQKHFFSFLLLWVLSFFMNSAHAQKLDYGLMGKVNVSSIYGPSRDSFNSSAAFGFAFFIEEKLKNSNISLALQPGYSQVAYHKEINALTYKSRNIELPIQAYFTPKKTEKTRLYFGVISNMQIAKIEEMPAGSNVNGVNAVVLKEKNTVNIGLSTGVDFQISKGFNLSFGYNYQLKTNYKRNEIINRPSHLNVALQFRFVDYAERNKPVDTITNALGNPKFLCVLLPTNPAEIKRWYNNEEVVLADFQTMVMNLFNAHYKATPVVFIADTTMNKWPNLNNQDIVNKSSNHPFFNEQNSFAVVKIGSYFTSGAKGENDGLFLMNQHLEVVNSPFIGFYKINFLRLNSPSIINEGLTMAIIKMNKQLESIQK